MSLGGPCLSGVRSPPVSAKTRVHPIEFSSSDSSFHRGAVSLYVNVLPRRTDLRPVTSGVALIVLVRNVSP